MSSCTVAEPIRQVASSKVKCVSTLEIGNVKCPFCRWRKSQPMRLVCGHYLFTLGVNWDLDDYSVERFFTSAAIREFFQAKKLSDECDQIDLLTQLVDSDSITNKSFVNYYFSGCPDEFIRDLRRLLKPAK